MNLKRRIEQRLTQHEIHEVRIIDCGEPKEVKASDWAFSARDTARPKAHP